MNDKHLDKTAFVTHLGLFKYMRMPFRLENAPSTFQRAMDVIPTSVKGQYAIVEIDNIIIFPKTEDEHSKHIYEMLQVLKNAGRAIKLKKCFFYRKTIDYLGHVIALGRLQVVQKATVAIKMLQYPTTASVKRSFLGILNVFRRFLPNLA